MNYKQLKPFDQKKAGSVPTMCLKNTRLGYGIAPKYDSAWQAWEATEQHKDRNIPKGIDVPVYFSYTATIDGVRKNWGHIGVRLANGKFWSDGTVYTSIETYERTHSPKYVGWGESVNDVKVIKKEEFVLEEQRPVFEPGYYLKANPDVKKAGYTNKTAINHWRKHGIKEGRPSARNFHVREYVANYPDLQKAFGKNYLGAVRHYFTHGINEGRSGRTITTSKTTPEDATWLYKVTLGMDKPTEAQKKSWTGRELVPLLKAIQKDARYKKFIGDPTSNDAEVRQGVVKKVSDFLKGIK